MNEPLAARLASDLDGSFEALVREHQDRLFGLAFRYLGSAADAEDIAQDAFVRAYRAMTTYEPSRVRDLDLRPWLTTILLNLCRNHVARPVRRVVAAAVAVDDDLGLVADRRGEPEVLLDRREAAERWSRLVIALPRTYRTAVLLRHLDGMSYQEMSAVLGRPEGTLKAQVHRGVALLRAGFEAEERGHAAQSRGHNPGSRHSPVPTVRTLEAMP